MTTAADSEPLNRMPMDADIDRSLPIIDIRSTRQSGTMRGIGSYDHY